MRFAKIAIVGTTSWGLCLAYRLAQREERSVAVLTRSAAEADELAATRTSKRLPSSIKLPPNIRFHHSPAVAAGDADLVAVCVPSSTIESNIAALRGALRADAAVLSATKGIQQNSGATMSQLIAEGLPQLRDGWVGAISGPNLSSEIAAGLVSCTTVAFRDLELAKAVQMDLHTNSLRVYSSDDLTGVEIGGAYKNIIAIGAGFVDALEAGANAKAAFVTRGLHEMIRYGTRRGGRLETFTGLSGAGDLMATCYSERSRNHRMGVNLARGMPVEDAMAEIGQSVEGVAATRAIVRSAKELGVELPIAELTHAVLFEGLLPSIVGQILNRDPKVEQHISRIL